MNTALLGPPRGLDSQSGFAPPDLYNQVHDTCNPSLQRVLERTDFWISTYAGCAFVALHCTGAKSCGQAAPTPCASYRDAQELIEGADAIATQLLKFKGSCYLGIYLDEDCVFFEPYPQVMNQHLMTHCYPHKGGPMFQKILNHFARRQAAQQRSELYTMQQEQTALWNERSRLLDRLIVRERAYEGLQHENLVLRQRLDVMAAELESKDKDTARSQP